MPFKAGKKKIILHITPHVGGGLGSVLLSTLKSSIRNNSNFSHEFIITDSKPLSYKAIKSFYKYRKNIHIKKSDLFIKKKIIAADIVQLEFWNHPQIYEFLTNFKFPRSRLIICSHISGFARPQIITENIVNFSDIFLSVSETAKSHPLFKGKNNILNLKKLKFVKFAIDFDRLKDVRKKSHKGFNVTYIGTLDYHKLHRDYLKMSNAINVPKIKFLICGGGDDKIKIEEESKKYSSNKFKFIGFVKNIKKILEITDIFGYPLNKYHYGTGEQVILEAMYSKIPVVAFSNYAEKIIIKNKENGLLVKNSNDYKKAIENLYFERKKRLKIGLNAHEHVVKNFSSINCFNHLEKTYQELMSKKKKLRIFKTLLPKNKKNQGSRLFIESLGDKANEFLKSYKNKGKLIKTNINNLIKNAPTELKSKNKGSLFQYLYYFPNDPYLNFWVGLISLRDDSVLKNKYKSIPKSSYECFYKAFKFNKKNREFKYFAKLRNQTGE
jgi:glycosyltransferase involved in cell wall biosynthesis